MKTLSISILAAGAALVAFSAPAVAAPPQPLPVPNPITCQLSDVTGAIACAGYYPGNIFSSSSADEGTQSTALTYLGFVGSPDFTTIYAPGSGYKVDFSGITTDQSVSFPAVSTLFGTTFIGVHWGGNQSAIYKLNLTTPVSSVTIKGLNPGGLSNAVLFGTETPVPEPTTWALMIAGLGAVGMSMRRRKTAVSFA